MSNIKAITNRKYLNTTLNNIVIANKDEDFGAVVSDLDNNEYYFDFEYVSEEVLNKIKKVDLGFDVKNMVQNKDILEAIKSANVTSSDEEVVNISDYASEDGDNIKYAFNDSNYDFLFFIKHTDIFLIKIQTKNSIVIVNNQIVTQPYIVLEAVKDEYIAVRAIVGEKALISLPKEVKVLILD